jgi:hypothetical protein
VHWCIVRTIHLSELGEPMARGRQPDLFVTESQFDLFGAEATPAYRPDPGKVRARLHKILAEARAAQTSPWEPARVSLYRTIFPRWRFGCRRRSRPIALRVRDGNGAAGDGLSCFLFGSITKVGMLLSLTRLDIVEPPSPARPARGEGIRLRIGASQFGA